MNGAGLSELELRKEVKKLEEQTGLVVVDPCRHGAGRLIDALIDYERRIDHRRREARQ